MEKLLPCGICGSAGGCGSAACALATKTREANSNAVTVRKLIRQDLKLVARGDSRGMTPRVNRHLRPGHVRDRSRLRPRHLAALRRQHAQAIALQQRLLQPLDLHHLLTVRSDEMPKVRRKRRDGAR